MAPIALADGSGGLKADVYFDNGPLSSLLKVCLKNNYVKVEPGMTLVQLRQ